MELEKKREISVTLRKLRRIFCLSVEERQPAVREFEDQMDEQADSDVELPQVVLQQAGSAHVDPIFTHQAVETRPEQPHLVDR